MAREYKIGPRDGAPAPKQDFETLTDSSPMPYGKYGPAPKGDGRVMNDVPAGYLLFLWDVDDGLWLDGPHLFPKAKAVRAYIKENFHALEMDAPDFNVKHHPDKMELPKKPKHVNPPTFRE
jgi:uncharacterized protein (DUF3820 family)